MSSKRTLITVMMSGISGIAFTRAVNTQDPELSTLWFAIFMVTFVGVLYYIWRDTPTTTKRDKEDEE